VAAAALFARIAQLGIGQTVVRFLPQAQQPSRLLNTAISTVALVSGALAILFLAGAQYWAPAQSVLSSSAAAVTLFVVLAISSALTSLLTWIFLACRKPVYSLIKYTIQAVLAVVLLFLFAQVQTGHMELLAAFTIATVIGLGIALFALLPQARPDYHLQFSLPHRDDVHLGGYALSNFAADLLRTAPHNLIPLLTINILGPAIGAALFVVWNIVIGLDSLAGAVSPSFFAEGANEPARLQQYTQRALVLGCGLGFLFTVGAVCIGKPLLALFGEEYADNGYIVLVLLVMAIVPSIIVSIYLNILRIRDRVRLLVAISLTDVVLGMLMVAVAMLQFGVIGIGAGWLLSRIIILITVVLISRTSSTRPQTSSA
jgi:O-antigen/teichoic acid export membrane protein